MSNWGLVCRLMQAKLNVADSKSADHQQGQEGNKKMRAQRALCKNNRGVSAIQHSSFCHNRNIIADRNNLV